MPSPMAETANTGNPKPDAPEQKKKRSKIVIIGVVLVLILVLGGGGYVFMSRRALANSKKTNKPEAPAKKADATPVAVIPLESFVVNLADPGQNSFLRIGITVALAKPLPKGSETPADSPFVPEIRDTILGVLNVWQSSSLLAPDGKAKLKAQLLAALQQRLPELGVADIYFTDFLIQQ
ncbi:MAG: flagellar basal body-associated FliL family protein [Terriglobia bacterium]